MREGKFQMMNKDVTNPILEAGKSLHEDLGHIRWGECNICMERWPDMKVGPQSGKCQRCASERLPQGIPPTFSQANDMDPGIQPECLKRLTSVETAAISLICPVLSIYKLRYGATGLKGHSISFHQNVQEFVYRLPRRPEDLPIIMIKAPNQDIPLKANRYHILEA